MSYLIAKNERLNKFKAVLATLAINALIVGVIFVKDSGNIEAYLPDAVAEWFSDEPAAEVTEDVATTSNHPRP